MGGIPISKLFVNLTLVFAMVIAGTAAHAQTFTPLYVFGTNAGDPGINLGEFPNPAAQGQDGNLYSATPQGGTNGTGCIFKITPTGALSVIYSFSLSGTSDGSSPYGGLTLGMDGNFYGTTWGGGTAGGNGTVFKVTPTGILTVLHYFTGTDGSHPWVAPVQGTDGNWYGTTADGGASSYGSVYKVTPSGKFTLLHSFTGTDGSDPRAALIQATDGNFYGTASTSGGLGDGTIFRIATSGKFTLLYNFDNTNGKQPLGGLIQASDGNFYGATRFGGATNNGVVYKLNTAGKIKITPLHSFNGTDGSQTYVAMVQANDGNLYGTSDFGGTLNNGTIYRISTIGIFSQLHSFDGASGDPIGELVQHTNGIFYSVTERGTPLGNGLFYSFNVSLSPFVSLMTTSGKVGSTVQILGQGFTGTTAVSFGGTNATTFSVVSDTYLTATVPSGAKTGTVTVTTPGGTLSSNHGFKVIPTVSGFTPPSGPPGTAVTITGTGLTQASKVTFGGLSATFTVNSDMQITATVPTGAHTGKISVTTPGGIATSAKNFTVL